MKDDSLSFCLSYFNLPYHDKRKYLCYVTDNKLDRYYMNMLGSPADYPDRVSNGLTPSPEEEAFRRTRAYENIDC